jgi:hypothetical protein
MLKLFEMKLAVKLVMVLIFQKLPTMSMKRQLGYPLVAFSSALTHQHLLHSTTQWRILTNSRVLQRGLDHFCRMTYLQRGRQHRTAHRLDERLRSITGVEIGGRDSPSSVQQAQRLLSADVTPHNSTIKTGPRARQHLNTSHEQRQLWSRSAGLQPLSLSTLLQFPVFVQVLILSRRAATMQCRSTFGRRRKNKHNPSALVCLPARPGAVLAPSRHACLACALDPSDVP